MSVYLSDSTGENQEMVASNKGWGELIDFVENVAGDDDALLHLVEHGYYEPAEDLAGELPESNKPDVQTVLDSIKSFAASLPGDEVIMVSGGLQPDDMLK